MAPMNRFAASGIASGCFAKRRGEHARVELVARNTGQFFDLSATLGRGQAAAHPFMNGLPADTDHQGQFPDPACRFDRFFDSVHKSETTLGCLDSKPWGASVSTTGFATMVRMEKKHAGQTLLTVMEREGVSANALADACGVSVQTVYKWIKTGEIARRRLPAITAKLRISADEIIGGISTVTDDAGLPRGRYVFIKRHKLALQGGDGPHDRFEEVDDEVAFRADFLRRRGWNADELTVIYARGHSMAPRIQPRDVLLIDTSQRGKVIEPGQVYAIRYGEDERIKRLSWRYDGALVISSDNPEPQYRDEVVPASDVPNITVIGRVVWVGGSM